jgi:methylthioribose-1-phosphate isomerase
VPTKPTELVKTAMLRIIGKMIIPVKWSDEGVLMLDQRLLPTEEKWLTLRSLPEVADGIRDMVVRGAPAIGVSAAYGIALGAKNLSARISRI